MNLSKKASFLFLVCVILFLSLSGVVGFIGIRDVGTLYLMSALAVSVPAFLIPSIIFRRKNRFPIAKAPIAIHIPITIGLGVGCILLNQALSYLIMAIFGDSLVSTNSTSAETIMGMNPWIMIIALAILPPLCEEFIMRGTLLESWRHYSPVGAVILTSVIFALLHSAPSYMLVYVALGLLLGFVYLITRNVWLCVMIHLINNLSSVIAAIVMKNSQSQIDPSAVDLGSWMNTPAFYLVMFVIFAVFACALIIPLMYSLKKTCKDRKIGMYSEEPDALESLVRSEGTAGRKPSMWADLSLWLTILLLVLINVLSGLAEFGVINFKL